MVQVYLLRGQILRILAVIPNVAGTTKHQ